jgi:protein SCO1/2
MSLSLVRKQLILSLIMVIITVVSTSSALAQKSTSDREKALLAGVGFDQNLDQQIPLNLEFKDETGQVVHLSQYFNDKPVILVMAYYECPMLCTLVLNGLLNGLKKLDLTIGKDFNVITVSINPLETPAMAAKKRDSYLTFYGRDEAKIGWHFLTGQNSSIKPLTEAIGFHYVYDDRSGEYAHPSGIIVATPTGKISRYFYGVDFPTTDLRLGLVEASANKIGSVVDQILLMCYHYNPDSGRYSLVITNVLQLMGLVTIVSLSLPIGIMLMREKRSKRADVEVTYQS